jgi:hypothetical protein
MHRFRPSAGSDKRTNAPLPPCFLNTHHPSWQAVLFKIVLAAPASASAFFRGRGLFLLAYVDIGTEAGRGRLDALRAMMHDAGHDDA